MDPLEIGHNDVVEFKVYYQDEEIRRFKAAPRWGAVIDKLRSLYGENMDFYVQYKDEEGDLVRISSDEEISDFVRLASPLLRLFVRAIPRTTHSAVELDDARAGAQLDSNRFIAHLPERHCAIYRAFVLNHVSPERRSKYLAIFAQLESVGYCLPGINTRMVGRFFDDVSGLPALLDKMSVAYEKRLVLGECHHQRKAAMKQRQKEERLGRKIAEKMEKRQAQAASKEEKQQRRRSKKEAKMARQRRALVADGYHPLPPLLGSWPKGITHLIMDGNNLLFVTSFLRRLVASKQLAKAEAVLALLTSAAAHRLGLSHARLIFDICTNSFSKPIAGKETAFLVQGASPDYATADDMIVKWASDHRAEISSSVFVTSDNGLTKRLRTLDPTALVVRPREFLVFLSVLLGDDLAAPAAVSEAGPVAAFDEFLSSWVRQQLSLPMMPSASTSFLVTESCA